MILNKNSYIIPATEDHIAHIAEYMRDEDLAEAYALGYGGALNAVRISLRSATKAWTWMSHGRPGCMFGVSKMSLVSEVSVIWFISTQAVVKEKVHFLRQTKSLVREIVEHQGHLVTVVDARYTKCLRWVAWLGFTIHEAKPIGMNGRMFHRIEMRG